MVARNRDGTDPFALATLSECMDSTLNDTLVDDRRIHYHMQPYPVAVRTINFKGLIDIWRGIFQNLRCCAFLVLSYRQAVEGDIATRFGKNNPMHFLTTHRRHRYGFPSKFCAKFVLCQQGLGLLPSQLADLVPECHLACDDLSIPNRMAIYAKKQEIEPLIIDIGSSGLIQRLMTGEYTAIARRIAQDPPPHAQGIERPSVNLLIAAPDDETPDGYAMPDLTGLPIVSVQAQLAKVGIKTAPPIFVDVPVPPVGTGNAQPAPPVAPGSVVTQEPPAGGRVDLATEVKLTVAK